MLLLSFVTVLGTTYAAQKAEQDPKITSKVSERGGSLLGTIGYSCGSRSVLVLDSWHLSAAVTAPGVL